jgi:quercetin dioxygenase-like cupin family protein
MAEDPNQSLLEGVKLLEFINYQQRAVVSREVLRKKNGTVTLFAFDAGQGLSEHTTPFEALANVLEGEIEIVVSGKPHQVKGGEMLLLPASQPHALNASKESKMLLIMIKS